MVIFPRKLKLMRSFISDIQREKLELRERKRIVLTEKEGCSPKNLLKTLKNYNWQDEADRSCINHSNTSLKKEYITKEYANS